MPAAAFLRLFTIIAALLVIVAVPVSTSAQQADAPTAESSDTSAAANAAATAELAKKQMAIVRGLAAEVDALEAKMRNDGSGDTELVDVRNELEALGIRLDASRAAFAPRLQEINHRLDQIGPPGDEGAEPEALKEERSLLAQEKADINAVLGEIENLALRIDRLINEIQQIRRELFATQLTKHYNVSDALSSDMVGDFFAELEHLRQTVSSWLQFILRFKLNATLLAGFISFAAAAVLFYGGRRLFGSLIFADPLVENPSYFSRLSVAFWSTLLPSLALAVFLGTSYAMMAYFDILWPDIARLLSTTFNVIATVFLVNRLAHALFSPALPNWSLIPVAPEAAGKLYWLVWVTSIATGFDFIFSRVNDVLGSPLSLTVAKSLLATFVVGVLVILIAFVKPFKNEDGSPRPWPRWLLYPLLALGLSTITAGILGYIGLARFISQQIVVTGAILATMYIGHLTARALSDLGAIRTTMFGRWLDRNFESNQTLEDQLGLLFSVSINVLVVAIGIPLILLQWGFQWGDITTWVLRSLRQIQVGSVSFSILDVLTGILVFVIGFFVTRWFQRWLDGSVMTRGRVDAGVRNSIKTVVGYTGIAIAILIGVSAAGINLSSLALVAGGLSLGVGFGLQNIVSNFVSGLILLVERPFKSGDWIVAGGVSGTVKKISVRATEIETFQRQSVILPNSELINSAVGNWTHKNRLGRVDIPVGVSYSANPRRVYEILMEIAKAHPTILKNPEPMVYFAGFGDSSLDFEVRFFLADVMSQLAIQNDIRFAIYDRLKEEGIEIPFPQRDLHIRTSGDIAEPKPPKKTRRRAPKKADIDPQELFPDAEAQKPRRRRKPRGHLGDE